MKVGSWGLEYEWQDLSIISKIISGIVIVFSFIWIIPILVLALIAVCIIMIIESILEKCGKKVNVHF